MSIKNYTTDAQEATALRKQISDLKKQLGKVSTEKQQLDFQVAQYDDENRRLMAEVAKLKEGK